MSREIGSREKGPQGRRWLRTASYGLIAVGLVLLVIAGVNLGYRQWERKQLQVQLTEAAVASSQRALPTLAIRATPTSPTAGPGLLEMPTSPANPAASVPATPGPTAEAELIAAEPTTDPTPAGNLPVRLVIADLGIDAQVVQMGWKVEEVGGTRSSVWRLEDISNGLAGHLVNSALPGQPDNVVIAGHHNIEGQVFRSISDAWKDDGAEVLRENLQWRSPALNGRKVTLQDAAGRQFTYVVEAMYKLADQDVPWEQRVENGRFMGPTGEPTLTLVTCWPSDSNTHRIVVVARLAGVES
jgi:hypothetical protein